MRQQSGHFRRGFSLLELVIVVVILGMLAAIAIPRMSRGSQGAAETALKHNLTILRDAIDRYSAEHSGQIPSVLRLGQCLANYTDETGTTFSMTKTAECYFGPYFRMPPPVLPVGRRKGTSGVTAAGGQYAAWVYDETTGAISANCDNDEVDATGTPYNQY